MILERLQRLVIADLLLLLVLHDDVGWRRRDCWLSLVLVTEALASNDPAEVEVRVDQIRKVQLSFLSQQGLLRGILLGYSCLFGQFLVNFKGYYVAGVELRQLLQLAPPLHLCRLSFDCAAVANQLRVAVLIFRLFCCF